MSMDTRIEFGFLFAIVILLSTCNIEAGYSNPYRPKEVNKTEVASKEGSVLESAEEENESEEWSWGYAYRLTGKIAFATTVVIGATAIGAATGGVGLAAAVNAGSAVGPSLAATLKVGGTLGGLFGAGVGTDIAINEFDEEEPSNEAKIASAVGKIAITTATLSPAVGIPSLASAVTEEGAKMLGCQVATLASPAAKLGSFATGMAANKVRSSRKK